jgi:signal transduction histidine kinase
MRAPVLAVLFGLLTASIFAVDVRTRLGANIPLLYIVPVLITLWHAPRGALWAPAICTALVVLRVMWFPSGDFLLGVVNRALTVLALWATAILLLRFKRAEARLRAQEEQVRAGEMAMTVAHELRNALAGIRAAVDVFGARLPATERDQHIRREMTSRVQSLEHFVVDLLALSRPAQPKPAPAALMPIVRRAVAAIEHDSRAGNLAIEIAETDAEVAVDAPLLESALVHLLRNAAEAMNGSGTITVSAHRARHTWRISIRDHGPGIPADIRQKIFEPFFTTRSRNRGLGLPIAKRIVEQHGGSLTIDSPPDGGAVVTMTLPSSGRSVQDA